LILTVLVFLISFTLPAQKIFYVMGTYAVVDLPSEKEAYRVYRYLKRLEEKLSAYRKDSDIYRLNIKAGESPIRVSKETVELLKLSILIWKKTYGYFNVFHKGKGSLSDLKIKGTEVFLSKKGMIVDPDGIGKGFAVEKAYRYISTDWGFIGVAGDMKVWGHRRILGIKNPLNGGVLMEMINKKDLCLSTSGNYYKKHIKKRDPKLVQITVVYENCTFADAYATALFAMDRKTRRRFEKENPKVGILELYTDGSFYMNKSFENYFEHITIR